MIAPGTRIEVVDSGIAPRMNGKVGTVFGPGRPVADGKPVQLPNPYMLVELDDEERMFPVWPDEIAVLA